MSQVDFLKSSVAGASACLVATGLLNPLEVVKIQIQKGSSNAGLGRTALRLMTEEGVWYGLMQPGLLAACSRELLYSSIRFAIYPELKQFFLSRRPSGANSASFAEKFGSGLVAGAVGSSLANPADLLKIRMQSEPGRRDACGRFVRGPRAGSLSIYPNTWHVLTRILSSEGGVRALYRGVSATCIRSSLLTAGQLSSYDHVKTLLKQNGLASEGLPLHVLASISSGFVAATCCAPADRLKTALMLQNGSTKTSLMAAAAVILRRDGLLGFYRGWLASYCRLAPHFIIVKRPKRDCAFLILYFYSLDESDLVAAPL